MKIRIPWLASILALFGASTTVPKQRTPVLNLKNPRSPREPLRYLPGRGEGYKRTRMTLAMMHAERVKFAGFYKLRAAMKRERKCQVRLLWWWRMREGRMIAAQRMAIYG